MVHGLFCRAIGKMARNYSHNQSLRRTTRTFCLYAIALTAYPWNCECQMRNELSIDMLTAARQGQPTIHSSTAEPLAQKGVKAKLREHRMMIGLYASLTPGDGTD